MNYYLIKTSLYKDIENSNNILFLGPWCLLNPKNKKNYVEKDTVILPPPWDSPKKIKLYERHCSQTYEKVIPDVAENLNKIHGVKLPLRYWKILIGPWLYFFIGVFYERYKRIEKAVELYPYLNTFVLPKNKCTLRCKDTADFFFGKNCKVNNDLYNLKLFSIILHEVFPGNNCEKDIHYEIQTSGFVKLSWKRRIYSNLINALNVGYQGSVQLNDMYHLTLMDMVLIKLMSGVKNVSFIESYNSKGLEEKYFDVSKGGNFRKKIVLDEPSNCFQALLYKTIPDAIPECYIEKYKYYSKMNQINSSVRILGSAVGWNVNENFKYLAANAVVKNKAKLIIFQHGGGLELPLASPGKTLAKDAKDIVYCWSSKENSDKQFRTLPSPHLSRLKDTYKPVMGNILFVGTGIPKYHYLFQSNLQPDDIRNYIKDKNIFLKSVSDKVRKNISVRPYMHDYGWNEIDEMKISFPDINFMTQGNLVKLMKKTKLVIIDHPLTSFLEALTINVPCVFYWDHNIFKMKPEAEPYVELLHDAEILYKNPVDAAKKVNKIFNDPMKWWMKKTVQSARHQFCERYAYSDKNWIRTWTKEIKKMTRKI